MKTIYLVESGENCESSCIVTITIELKPALDKAMKILPRHGGCDYVKVTCWEVDGQWQWSEHWGSCGYELWDVEDFKMRVNSHD